MSKHKGRHGKKGVFLRRAKPPGTPPETLRADPNAPRTVVRVIAYGPGDYVEAEVTDLRGLRRYLEEWPVTWVDVEGLGDVKVLETLGELFGLHGLALEDVLHVHQRPKVEEYDGQIFVVTRMARFETDLETEQVSMFLGKGFVLTFQEGRPGDCFEGVRDHIRNKIGRIRGMGADYLLYCQIDAIIDHYFPVLEHFGEHMEDLEVEVVSHPNPQTISRIHAVKRHLLDMRRVVWPLREALQVILRDTDSLITPQVLVYLRDCHDHAVQVVDLIEIYRELTASLTDIYLSSISNRMNEVMKVLTIIATIFIPLTFLVGLYGMNYNTEKSPWNMPELNWYYGYPLLWLMMIGVFVGMLIYFYRKGWLSSSIPVAEEAESRSKMSASNFTWGVLRWTSRVHSTTLPVMRPNAVYS